MTVTKKLSRRDAIKLLGAAAGATVLANLPSKWSKPELASGVLPAHAQTSCVAVFLEILSATGIPPALGIVVAGPFPDAQTGVGDVGSTATWYCQPDCLEISIGRGSFTTATIRITTLSNQITFNFDDANPNDQVLIDLSTGAVALNGVGSAGSCNWAFSITSEEGLTGQTNIWGN